MSTRTAVLLLPWITCSMSLLLSAVSAVVSLLPLWQFSSMTLPAWKQMHHSATLPAHYNFPINFHQSAMHVCCPYISCIHRSNNSAHLMLGPLLQLSRHIHLTRRTSIWYTADNSTCSVTNNDYEFPWYNLISLDLLMKLYAM